MWFLLPKYGCVRGFRNSAMSSEKVPLIEEPAKRCRWSSGIEVSTLGFRVAILFPMMANQKDRNMAN